MSASPCVQEQYAQQSCKKIRHNDSMIGQTRRLYRHHHEKVRSWTFSDRVLIASIIIIVSSNQEYCAAKQHRIVDCQPEWIGAATLKNKMTKAADQQVLFPKFLQVIQLHPSLYS